MRVKVMYLINGTTKTTRFLCDSATAQISYDGSVVNFVNGRDNNGAIEAVQGANIEWIEHRPGGENDEAWLLTGMLESR